MIEVARKRGEVDARPAPGRCPSRGRSPSILFVLGDCTIMGARKKMMMSHHVKRELSWLRMLVKNGSSPL